MSHYLKITKAWIQELVIGLNLCPFAQRPFATDKIRFILMEEVELEELVEKVLQEALYLSQVDTMRVETTIIIHPDLLLEFELYLDAIALLEDLLKQLKLEGIIQIASFHPDYQFEGTKFDDVENYTNRAPFPLIHLLREDLMEAALENYPNPEQIPERNIKKMQELGKDKVKELLDKF